MLLATLVSLIFVICITCVAGLLGGGEPGGGSEWQRRRGGPRALCAVGRGARGRGEHLHVRRVRHEVRERGAAGGARAEAFGRAALQVPRVRTRLRRPVRAPLPPPQPRRRVHGPPQAPAQERQRLQQAGGRGRGRGRRLGGQRTRQA